MHALCHSIMTVRLSEADFAGAARQHLLTETRMCPGHGTIPGEDHGHGSARPGAAALSGSELSCAHGVHRAGVRPMEEQRTWAQIQTTSVNLRVVSAHLKPAPSGVRSGTSASSRGRMNARGAHSRILDALGFGQYAAELWP